MNNRASFLIKLIIATMSSMAKSRTLALKSKMHRIKPKLIIFSLLRNKKYFMSYISQKLQSLLSHHHHHHSHSHHKQEDYLLNENHQSNHAIVVYSGNAHCYDSLINSSEIQVMEEKDGEDGYGNYCNYGDGISNDDKYLDLTHYLFNSEGLDFEGSMIDLVKNSKEEVGKSSSWKMKLTTLLTFSLENSSSKLLSKSRIPSVGSKRCYKGVPKLLDSSFV